MGKFIKTYHIENTVVNGRYAYKIISNDLFINIEDIIEIHACDTGYYDNAVETKICRVETKYLKVCQWWCWVIGWLGFRTKRYKEYYVKKEDVAELFAKEN